MKGCMSLSIKSKIIIVCLLMITFLSGFVFSKTTNELLMELKSLQQQIEYANNLNDLSLLDASLESVNRLLLNNPGNLDFEGKAHVVLADAYFYKGSYNLAIEEYDKAMGVLMESSPEYPYSLYSLIYAYYYLIEVSPESLKANYINQAIFNLDKLSSFDEYKQDALLLKGMILKQRGDLSGAVTAFDQITRGDLTGTASYYKGLILYEQKNYPAAILAFEKAASLGQNRDLVAASIYRTINAMINLKYYKEALEESQKLVRDFGSSRYKNEIFSQHVQLLYRTGDYNNAKRYIENELLSSTGERERMEALNVLGWLAYETGNISEAIVQWEKAVDTGYVNYKQEAFEIAKTCLQALGESNDSTKTLTFLNNIKSKFPEKKTELDLETAKVYMNTNRYSQAEVLLNQVLSTGMYFNEVNYLMAVLNKQRNNSRAAFDYISRVISSGNREYTYKGYLFEGDLYFQLGNYQEAKRSYENALKNANEKERLQTILNLGIVEMELENYPAAVGQFNQLKQYTVEDLDAALNGAFYLAECYTLMNDINSAVKQYDWIIANDKTGRYVSTSVMRKYDLMINNPNADLDALIRELDTQIQSTTDLTLKDELMFLKAEAYMKKGDLLTAYNFVRDINYDRLSAISKAAVLYIRGKYFMSQGNEPQMITNFDSLISDFPKSPKTPWAMQDYALFYYNSQNYNQAKNIFFNLLTKYPDFQKVDVAYFYIGLCYEKMAENDKAKQVFTDFLEKFPNSSRKTEVQQHLSWLD